MIKSIISKYAGIIAITLGMMLMSVMSSHAQAGCNFACNDTINVSVNRDCEALITADMVLDGYDFGSCPVPPTPRVFDAQGRLISNLLTRQYVGQYLKFEMTNSAQGTCWGYIKLEDKLPPEIVCPGNDTLKCNATDYAATNADLEAKLKRDLESTIVDNCGNEELQIIVTSNVLSKECNNQFSATRSITFIALDNHANADTCSFQIFYESVPPLDVDPPKNYTENMVLNCTTPFPLNADSIPYPTVEYLLSRDGGRSVPNINGRALAQLVDGRFITDNLCNFKISYSDQLFPSCGGSYKIVRTWRVIDWCNTNIPMDFYQVIKVVDTSLRITNCPTNQTLGTDGTTCAASVAIERPIISTNECSDWTWTVMIREPQTTTFTVVREDNSSGLASFNHTFDLGTSTIKYIVKDECDNIDSCQYTVTVEDDDAPHIACDERTIVSLNDDFKAKVFAKSFDDESFDACSEITYQVRRVDGGCSGNSLFGDFVEFCCEDLGKTIMVELRITDEVGLFSTCMASAVIQFEGDILDITCPAPQDTFDCRTFDNFNFGQLRKPVVLTDNTCVGSLTPTPVVTSETIDECGVGYKDIDWTIPYNGTDQVICSQRVQFRNMNPFLGSSIRWPADRTISTCDDLAPTQSEIDRLLPSNIQCANVVYSEPQDRVFDDISHACLKVLRKWTVVDWCRYPNDPSAIWTYTQTIIIKESADPEFTASVATVDIQYAADCESSVTLTPLASDDCTSAEDLIWTQQLDIVDGLSTFPVIRPQPGSEITTTLDFGTYRATWTVEDACGNITTATKDFEIEDNEKPLALCASPTVSIDETTEIALLTAQMVDDGSSDICDNDLLVRIRRVGSAEALSSQLVLSCDDVGELSVELVVEDDAGNTDMCVATVRVTDPDNTCSPSFFADQLPCGYVMDFDGEDDYISVPSLSVTPAFTIEAYLYVEPQQVDGFISLFEYGNDSPFIGLDAGRPTIFGQVLDTDTLALNTWTHVAFTYDPSTNRSGIYINGVLSELGVATTTFEGVGLGIAYHMDDAYFKGKMDEIRIWDRALSGQEIKANVPTIIDRKSDGLVAYYDFNAIAAVAIDRTNAGHAGTLHGLSGENPLPQQELTGIPCPPDGSGASLDVTGMVVTPDLVSVEAASLSITQDQGTTTYSNSAVDGSFTFEKVAMSKKYELKASKNDDLANGVTVSDIIAIQRHVLGLRALDTPYKLLAADMNGSKNISTADLALMRKIILGVTTELPNGMESWQFVPADHQFRDPVYPFDYESSITEYASSTTAQHNDFIGVKMGDVNGTAVANSATGGVRSAESISLGLREASNGRWEVFAATDMDLAGFQMTLPVGSDAVLETHDLEHGQVFTHFDEESLRVLYHSDDRDISLAEGTILFSIDASDVDLATLIASVDPYDQIVLPDLTSHQIVWSVEDDIDGLTVAQNRPNPFTQSTDIVFEISEATDVTVSIFGADGVHVYGEKQYRGKGRHTITIDKATAGLNKGIYYYQIQTHNRSLVHKMIVL